ncbi:Dolichyl-phosphate-mannose-protein mannosyltransferase [Micromonospora viridifaciens]|uniref:Dolichyl-phosphate-mannose-protein mannosyltransferase n=1 Tax=Micromonospora viridifaciens TaxID=1881 RepID=A0A1C4XI39_MICVI|nr:glycosyltransferase family 39 protein [Micromonospora viridifaciens]SCF08117.1 Dolichyl-phosphate-mannose-protein mannosyltransferase [Micromonospora viridifaciens]
MNDAETMVLPRLGPVGASVEDPWGEGPAAVPGRPPAATPAWRITAWLVPALMMATVSMVRAGGSGPRVGEVAAWRAATSSWPDVLRSGDVTVAPYHLLIRAWAEAFGTSELALRGPSVLAMTAAAALVATTASRLFGPGTGLLAGAIFALLPTSARYAQEAQPYALTLFAAVLATSLLVPATERPTLRRLAAYGGAVVLLGLCHVVALLLLVGHGWTVLAFRRGTAVRWLAVAVAGSLPAAALLWSALRHGTWLGPVSDPNLPLLAELPGQLFGRTALGAVLLGLALFSLPLRHSVAIYTAWAAVPPLVLLLVAQAAPIWEPRYLLFTLPAWATLGAVALARLAAGAPHVHGGAPGL